MSFINMGEGFTDTKPPETVPEGMYDLIIEGGTAKEENGVLQGVSLFLAVEDNPDAATVFHYISVPQADDEEKTVKFKQQFAKKFFDIFGIDSDGDGFELADIAGATAKCKLGLGEYKGKVSNKIIL